MPNYRGPRITGASIFFTVALADRNSDLLARQIDALRDAVARTRAERPFQIEAWVVLPDHLHCVWQPPAGDAGFSVRWGAIKARFSRSCRRAGSDCGNPGFGSITFVGRRIGKLMSGIVGSIP